MISTGLACVYRQPAFTGTTMYTFETWVRVQDGQVVTARVQAQDWYQAMLLFKAMYGEDNVTFSIQKVDD